MSNTPPAGWYPAPHANNEMRYWDGRQWLEPAPTAGSVSTIAEAPSPAPAIGLAVSALVVGIVAFVTAWVPWLGLLLAISAVALGILALVRRQSKGLAVTGLALGSVALIVALLVTISFSAFVGGPSSASRDSEEEPVTSIATPEATFSEGPAEPEEPTAPEADGTVANPFPQPYIAEGLLGGQKYSLTGRIVDANAGATLEEWNMFNADAPAGFKYVVVELTMTGKDPDGVEPSIAGWDLYLATGEGNRYSSEGAFFGDGMPSMSDGPTLYPGSTFTGYAAYVVPETAERFLLYDNGNYIAF